MDEMKAGDGVREALVKRLRQRGYEPGEKANHIFRRYQIDRLEAAEAIEALAKRVWALEATMESARHFLSRGADGMAIAALDGALAEPAAFAAPLGPVCLSCGADLSVTRCVACCDNVSPTNFPMRSLHDLQTSPAPKPVADLTLALRVIFGMSDKGCEAPNAAYRWCERIDEVFHDISAAEQYVDWALDLPPAFLAALPPAPDLQRADRPGGCTRLPRAAAADERHGGTWVMLSNAIEGATRRIGKSQGYKGLAIRDEVRDGVPVMVTSWQPTPAEVARIVAGAPVYVALIGQAHPPILLEVGDTP